MRLEFLAEGPAVVVENAERTLVVADLHFGIESDLARHGWHFSSRSLERMQRVTRLVDRTKPDRLLLLGDVKQSVPFTTRQEWRELPEVLAGLRARVPILVVPGNHDPGIERFLGLDELAEKTGVVVDGVGYLHGHTLPAPCLAGQLVLVGHHHPLAAVQDEVGCALRAPAYLMGEVDDACLGLPPAGDADAGPLRPVLQRARGLRRPADRGRPVQPDLALPASGRRSRSCSRTAPSSGRSRRSSP